MCLYQKNLEDMQDYDESKLPKFATVVGIIMIPLLLILTNTVVGAIINNTQTPIEFFSTY